MDERIPPPGYFHYSPSGVHSSPSPHHSMRPSAATSDRERYLAELLAERQKLGPFLQILPFCYRLLNQEILRASAFISNPTFIDHERIEHASPLRLTGHPFNGEPMDLEARSGMYTESRFQPRNQMHLHLQQQPHLPYHSAVRHCNLSWHCLRLVLLVSCICPYVSVFLYNSIEVTEKFVLKWIISQIISANLCFCRKVYATHAMVGPFPQELQILPYLFDLNLAQKNLTGPLPAFLGNFTDMQYLSVGINGVSRPVPLELGNL